ncbi:hypothetical protein BDV95DRAFT_629345 [Massariosphaeria phaeospora]|uniref:Uncharacterized protein n=1 Tax=Massariosphaeria phaeospora TaxID=100035 RepID=A0A7C8I4V3_9PLEO|nr:hypothetical protein BDV95DRAFT_629345 [Massariosphaeria phaeospora]
MSSAFNPLYMAGPPLLLLISIPLSVFATVTTTIAIGTLTVRVSILYFELAVAILHSYLFPLPSKLVANRPSRRRTSLEHSRRRSSTSTASSQDTAIPATPQSSPQRRHQKSGSLASIVGTSQITRDFEGVGGWRLPGNDDEEALWMGMNSRLQLPAVIAKRHHQRSLTGGSPTQRWSWNADAARTSPVQSRARTPIRATAGEGTGADGYFPPLLEIVRPLSSSASDLVGRTTREERRKSASGSSTSSAASSWRAPIMAVKEASE